MTGAEATANRRRAAAVVGVLAGLLFVILFLVTLLFLPAVVGLLVAAVLAVAMAVAAAAGAESLALRLVRAEPASPNGHARLHNLVESLCFSAGLPKPGVYVVQDRALNAFAVGRGRRHASIGVTSGLLDELTRVELEAVIAHGLSLVKSDDVAVSTLAVTLLGVPASLLPGDVAERLVDAAVGAGRRPAADLAGVSLTRYPPGLIAALEKLRGAQTAVAVRARIAGSLWLHPFDGRLDAGTPGPAGDLLDARIQALREL